MLSVLPGKNGYAAMVRKTVKLFSSQPDVLTVTDLEPFFAKDLLGTISKKTGVSSMLTTNARAYFPFFKNLAHIS